MTILYILRNHDKIEQEACEHILAARAKLNDERERIYARFGGSMKFTDEVFSGTRDPDAKIAAAIDEILVAEQEYIARTAAYRTKLEVCAQVWDAVGRLPEPYRELFVRGFYAGGEIKPEEKRRIDEGLFVLRKQLNALARPGKS